MKQATIHPLLAVLFLANLGGLSAQDLAHREGSPPAAADSPLAPDEYLGYSVGADFKLASWDSITGYLNHLADFSPAVRLDTLGLTTLGKPFVLAIFAAPENFERLSEILANQAKLADPRKLEDGELETILASQPAVVFMAHNLHSTEIGSSQGSMELAHALVTDPQLLGDLEDVVVLLLPSANPDGQVMVVDWYRRTLGTPYEGSRLPWLYHHFAGHDNNRDWFMLNLVETRMVNDLLYKRWFPEVVYDVHQMGNRGARFFIPPFDDPVNPNLDPLLVRMISLFGIKISTDLEAAGKSGVVNSQNYDLWWHGGNRTVPARHNMVGILSETASARYASPIFQERGQLDREPSFGVSYPNPWPGGWWRIRDIIDYQMIAARSIIGFASAHRRELLSNYVELGSRAVRTGLDEPPFAYVVPASQTDVGSAARMLEILRQGGVEIHRAGSPFEADGVRYEEGSWVVSMAQPYRAHAKDLLERQDYPDLRVYPGGPPDRPYDVSGWTLPLQMGVEAIPVVSPFDADLSLETDTIRPTPAVVSGTGDAYATDNSSNAAALAIHRTLRLGGEAILIAEPLAADDDRERTWPAGTVILRGEAVRSELEALAASEGVSFAAVSGRGRGYRLADLRVGLYQSWTARMDEGWIRYVFEEWEMPYRTLHDAEIRAGGLEERYDVIVIPDMSLRQAVEGRDEGTVPGEFAGGLGEPGVNALRSFVRSGGTLICLSNASNLAIERLGVPITNTQPPDAEQRLGTGFYAPGSILRAHLDPTHPLGFGMPEDVAVYYSNSPIFDVHADAPGVTVVARYAETDQLLSGYALNADSIAGKAALVEAELGAGRIILFGFRPQHRGQPHETFKLLFNAVYRGASSGLTSLEF